MSEPVRVMRGENAGPYPGVRDGDVLAYEFELDESYVPRPGRTRLERVYVLPDLGVQLSNPPADAVADGSLTASEAVDALRRWQRFLDRHLHAARFPVAGWTDFPPACLAPLAALPAPLAAVDTTSRRE